MAEIADAPVLLVADIDRGESLPLIRNSYAMKKMKKKNKRINYKQI